MVWYVVAGLLIVLGLLGTVLPALPGVPLIFAGMWMTAWLGNYAEIAGTTVIFLGALTVLAMLVDFAASAFGVKVVRASRSAFIGAALGTVVGLFFGILGLLLCPFLGAVVGELFATSDVKQATRAGVGATLGLFLGAVAKIALAFTMLAIFVLALIF
jgi:hypothetical protein